MPVSWYNVEYEEKGSIMAYEKLYNEIYAVVMLKFFWQDYQSGFVKSESPDWSNGFMNLGMEVSQALMPYDGQSESFIDHYLGHLRSDIPEVELQKYNSRLYFYNNRLWALLDEDHGSADYRDKVMYRFECKLNKLNSNYKRFATNSLYLYVHSLPKSQDETESIMEAMIELQDNRDGIFDVVFLDCESELYILHLPLHKILRVNIPDRALVYMNDMTESLRHRVIWENGTAFDDNFFTNDKINVR